MSPTRDYIHTFDLMPQYNYKRRWRNYVINDDLGHLSEICF